MTGELMKNTNLLFQQAEEKALQYFQILLSQVEEKTFVPILMKDFQIWKHDHIHGLSFFSFFSRKTEKPETIDYQTYIRWLDRRGKLGPYLDRSISYIFMRDLGKALNTKETQERVQKVTDSLKKYLRKGKDSQSEVDGMTGLYRWAQREGVEPAFIWLVNKLKKVSANLPSGLDVEHAQRKLFKIIAGVLMHATEDMGEVSPDERKEKLTDAIKLGYSYGLTYPFIDDLMDANILSPSEKRQYSNLIRTTLITHKVPELGVWNGLNETLIRYIHSELREAFDYIKSKQPHETRNKFFEQAFVFFQSQEIDRKKTISNPHYTNEELYIPIILKSSSSRLIARSVIHKPEDLGFDSRTFYYGIYNQLADDFTDMFSDMEDGAVTPYTYYMKYHQERKDLINPFELYWAVISNLIHNIYQSDPKTCEVILDRAVNGLKRFKERMGTQKYREVINLFASDIPEFNKKLQKIVQKADNVDFFDKLLRDYMITILKKERGEQDEFKETLELTRLRIDGSLEIQKEGQEKLIQNHIIDAANYSLESGGKRLRPIITWVIGVREYGLKEAAILPLLRSLEYMHTASLIFDDLPAQDNAPFRRGRKTLHHVYNTAIGELTGLFLTQKAIEEQTSLDHFHSKSVLNLIRYSAQVTELMCQGQAMDLNSKGKTIALEQLNTMCFYKTGIAFEASLIMPAILAGRPESELNALKKFAMHAGIAFQIKDDLLDVEGDFEQLGKPIGNDALNRNSTFVSVLGLDGAQKEMWEHYCQAMEVLQVVPQKTTFLKHLMNYIVNRDH